MLMELDEAKKFFPNHTRAQLKGILKSLGIPFLYDRDRVLFNLYTLERVINYLLRVDGPGFAAPGSTYRNKQRYKTSKGHPPVLQIDETHIKEMSDPKVVAEMLATGPKGKSSRASYIATLRELEKGKG
jgi:hypothetical protein